MNAEEATSQDVASVVIDADWLADGEDPELHARLVLSPDFQVNLDWGIAAILVVKAVTAAALTEFAGSAFHVCNEVADDEEEAAAMVRHMMTMIPVHLAHQVASDPFLQIGMSPLVRKGGENGIRLHFSGTEADFDIGAVMTLATTSMRSAVHASISNALVEGLVTLPEGEGGLDVKTARSLIAHINQHVTGTRAKEDDG